jgi:hypothetical protein
MRLGDERRGTLLVVAADLADHHDEVGLLVGLEAFERSDEPDAVHRVAPHPDARGLADAALGELVHDLVRERPAAADRPTRPGAQISPG